MYVCGACPIHQTFSFGLAFYTSCLMCVSLCVFVSAFVFSLNTRVCMCACLCVSVCLWVYACRACSNHRAFSFGFAYHTPNDSLRTPLQFQDPFLNVKAKYVFSSRIPNNIVNEKTILIYTWYIHIHIRRSRSPYLLCFAVVLFILTLSKNHLSGIQQHCCYRSKLTASEDVGLCVPE